MSIVGVLFLFSALLFPCHFSSHALCTNSKVPFYLESILRFCSYNGSSCCCCGSAKIVHLQQLFPKLNVSNPACASLLKSVLCSTCGRFSADLLKRESVLSNVSVLRNSKFLEKSSQSHDNTSSEVCRNLWHICSDRSLDDAKLQFNGKSVSYYSLETQPPSGLCLEKIGTGAYLNMVPHPDGSNRVFLGNQQGKIWLANVPDEGSNGTLEIVESEPFLDITDGVAFDTGLGLMGMAFHPNFVNNGRFFLSFNCDKMKQPGCVGRCACNTDVNCDPADLGANNGVHPCQYHTVIAEYTVNDSTIKPSLAKGANLAEVRRILTMGLPFSGGHAGQILFGPADGYLYLMIADGSHREDPYNFAQNKKSFLGKILRIDVNHIPSARKINELGLWGNYSIPEDNPYIADKELEPEIWALGLKNPWRCSFDSERPYYFLCGDSGEDQYEEVDIIVKGGNYGWRVYEGPLLFHPSKSPGGSTSPSSINAIFPVMGYYHSEVDMNVGSASIAAGYFYRSTTDPCMYGRYLYSDLYAGVFWAGTEIHENSGNFSSSKIPFRCAHNSPIQCSFVAGNSVPEIGYVFSFAEDNKKDIYILTSTGVYRVARPSRCNFTCAKERFPPARPQSSSLKSRNIASSSRNTTFFISLLLLVLHAVL